jgi:hypothetical protein
LLFYAKERLRSGRASRLYCTVNDVVPGIPPEFTPMVVRPALPAVARPAEPCPFAIVATLAFVELQWLFKVTSWVVASLKVPVAENCSVLPAAMVGLIGEIAIDTSVPLPTTNVAVPVIPESEADIVTVPTRLPCATPLERTDANCGLDDFQETPRRVAIVLPSLNVPLAVNLIEVPSAMWALPGFTEIDVNFAVDTVNIVDPLIAPEVADMVVVPVARLVTSP